MGNIADELRVLFADRADDAPPGLELLAAAKARSRRHLIRRRAAVAGVVAVAVGASAATVPLLLQRQPAGRPIDVGAPPVQASSAKVNPSPSSQPPSSAAPIQFATATTQPTVAFPYTPGYTPPGLAKAAVLRTQTDFIMHARQTDDSKYLKLEIHNSEPTLDNIDGVSPASKQSVRVRNRTGTIASGDASYLYWLEKPGQWLSVQSIGVSRADVLKYAENVRAQTLSGTEPFHFTLLPVGMEVHESLHYNMTFAPIGSGRDGEPVIGLVVTKNSPATPGGTAVQVGTHHGYLVDDSGHQLLGGNGHELIIDLGSDASMTVDGNCTDSDLVRFAAGITVDLNQI
jgi:hypothetical protein